MHLSRILLTGTNRTLSATAFQDAALPNPCRCPECGGSVTREAQPFTPDAKAFEPGCRTCGGRGINLHRRAA